MNELSALHLNKDTSVSYDIPLTILVTGLLRSWGYPAGTEGYRGYLYWNDSVDFDDIVIIGRTRTEITTKKKLSLKGIRTEEISTTYIDKVGTVALSQGKICLESDSLEFIGYLTEIAMKLQDELEIPVMVKLIRISGGYASPRSSAPQELQWATQSFKQLNKGGDTAVKSFIEHVTRHLANTSESVFSEENTVWTDQGDVRRKLLEVIRAVPNGTDTLICQVYRQDVVQVVTNEANALVEALTARGIPLSYEIKEMF